MMILLQNEIKSASDISLLVHGSSCCLATLPWSMWVACGISLPWDMAGDNRLSLTFSLLLGTILGFPANGLLVVCICEPSLFLISTILLL